MLLFFCKYAFSEKSYLNNLFVNREEVNKIKNKNNFNYRRRSSPFIYLTYTTILSKILKVSLFEASVKE